MKKETRTVEWKTSSGLACVFTAELTLEKTCYADGWNVKVDCCEFDMFCEVEGHGRVGHNISRIKNPLWAEGAVAAIGNLCIKQDTLDLIDAAIAEVKSHPTWVAKQKLIEKNRKEVAEYEARRDANGYCRKCGSYCYGDCGL